MILTISLSYKSYNIRKSFYRLTSSSLLSSSNVETIKGINFTQLYLTQHITFDYKGVESKDDIEKSENGIPIVWTAAVKSSAKVKEQKRTTEDYMRLPPSEYSVLSGFISSSLIMIHYNNIQ